MGQLVAPLPTQQESEGADWEWGLYEATPSLPLMK